MQLPFTALMMGSKMAKDTFPGFDAKLFKFLKDLSKNNNRDWFKKNKPRYEAEVLEPAQAFVRAFAAPLKKLSPMFVADDRRVGGSIMRIYRDTRFSKDKTPYKTNVGIHFRHEMGKDVHAPGFYVHLATDGCFLGAGMWMPDNKILTKIRDAIVDDPDAWKRLRDGKKFRDQFKLSGEQLKTAPRGFPKDHKYIEDLRRKSFIGVKDLSQKEVLKKDFAKDVSKSFATAKPFIRFLCQETGVPF